MSVRLVYPITKGYHPHGGGAGFAGTCFAGNQELGIWELDNSLGLGGIYDGGRNHGHCKGHSLWD